MRIEVGKKWKGPAYRGDDLPWYQRGLTVADIVKYETVELGNTLDVPTKLLAKYGHLSARYAIWVTKTPEAARRYGEPIKVDLAPDSIIIGQDDEGGI